MEPSEVQRLWVRVVPGVIEMTFQYRSNIKTSTIKQKL